MRRLLFIIGLLLCAATSAMGNEAAHGWCEVGAQVVVTSGLTSTTQVQRSFPQCTITVYNRGSSTLATIYADNSATPLANPFTAGTNGQWIFYAANGRYDVQMSGAGFPTPVTYTDILLNDFANQAPSIACTTVTYAPTLAFDATNNACYTVTLTGNLTFSITGTPANGNFLKLQLYEDGVGGHLITFPLNFSVPASVPVTTANYHNDLLFNYDTPNLEWQPAANFGGNGAGGVVSFNGRTGAVVSATNDYAFNQISGVAQPSQGGTGSATPTTNGVAVAQGASTPYLFVLPTNNAQCFMSDPTNYLLNPPSYQTCPSSTGGSSVGAQGTVNAAGASAGSFAQTSIWDINGPGGTYFRGLNPYIDVTHPTFGGYIGPHYNAAATTCTMSASSTTASCASASDFLGGQGILIVGAGPAPVIATPQAPTVTPLFQVGSTTRSYCIADRDWFGGLTPCSPVGSTAIAPSSMALQSYSIASWSWNSSTNTMTITTSANHNMPTTASGIASEPYAQVEIQAGTSSSGLCEGSFSLTAVPSATQLQFQRNELTSNPSCSGGTLRIAPKIILKWDSHYTYSVTAASCSAGTATISVSPVPLGPDGTWVIPSNVKAITSGISDSHYNGTVSVAPATGAFTFGLNCSGVTNVGAGGTLSLVPGKAVKNHLVYACNGGSCALPANAANYSLVGVAQGNDGYFIDRGWAISSSSVDLGAPSTAPTTAINEWLDTTITAGGGTTTLTLANPSTNAVTSAGAWHDNFPNILAACATLPANSSASNGGHIIVPATGSLYNYFPIIANLDLVGNFAQAPKNCPGNTTIDFGSEPWMDGSIMLGKGDAIQGAAVQGATNCQTTFYQMGPALGCGQGNSYPMIYFEPEQASSNFLKDFALNPQGAYQSGVMIDEQMNGDGTVSLRTDNFHVNGGIHSYPIIDRAGFQHSFNYGGWSNGGGNFSESIVYQFQPLCGMPNYYPFVAAPLPYIVNTNHTYSFGTMEIDSCGQASGNFGNTTVFNDLITESNAGPPIKANLYPYGVAQLTINYANNADLIGGSSTPYLDVTNATIGSAAFNFIGCGTSTQPLFETNSANPYSGIHLTMGLGCNGGIGYPPLAGVVYENLYRNQWKWNGMQFAMTNGGRLTAGQITTPAVAPTVTVTTSCTGFPPAGTYTYGVLAWDATSNPAAGTGGATTVGPASTSVTLNGTTQCASIAQPTLPTGTAYWGTARLSGPGSVDQVFISGVSSINAFVPVTTTTIVDQTTFTAGSVPSINTTGLQSVSAGNITGNIQPITIAPLTDNTVPIGTNSLHFTNLFLNTRQVSTLPTASTNLGAVFIVTDGQSTTDCTSGGGSFQAWCRSNGTSWGSVSGAVGGSVTAFTAPSGSWPTWLVPTVTNGTTTPQLTVAASTIPVGAGGTGATTLSGVIKGNATSPFTVAAAADIFGLWSGTCNLSTNFLRSDGVCAPPPGGMVYPSGSGFAIVAGGTSWGTTLADPLTPTHGGSGLSNPAPHSLMLAEGASNYNLVTSPSTNGFYQCGFNVTASVAVDLTCAPAGVSVNLLSGNYPLVYSDRASFQRESSTTTSTLTLPQVAGNTASNFPFVTANFNSANETLQANAADKIDGGSLGGTQNVLPGWAAFVYQDSTSAPGNWWSVILPMLSALPTSCADSGGNHINFTAAGGFTCGSTSSGGTPSFPLTVTGTVNSGGIPYFSSTTQESSSATLGAGAIVFGGGAGGAPTTGAGDFTYSSHTLSGGASAIFDLSAAASFKIPSSAACAPTTAALLCYDSTNNRFVGGNGTNTSYLPWFLSAPASLNLVEWNGTLGKQDDTGIATANVTQTVATPSANQICVYASTAKTCTPTTTLPTPAVPAFSGDMTNSLGSLVTAVGKINGGSYPTNAHVVGSNGSSQPTTSTRTDIDAITYAAGGGSANAQTVTLSPAVTSYTTGLTVRWKPTAANTNSTPTLAVNGLSAITIVKIGGATLSNSDLTTTAIATAIYDGTNFELQNPQTGQPATGTAGGDLTGSYPNPTVAANAITGAKMANNTVTATQLAAQYSKGSCTEAWGGSGTSHALTSGDDAVVNNTCYNDSGVTRTITAVKCRSDNGSNTTTVNPTFGSAGTGTTILSGALTCGNSYAYSSSGTVSNASWTTGTGIDPAMGGTLTGTSIAVIIEYTY